MELKQTDGMGGNFKFRTNSGVSFNNIANLIQFNIAFRRFMYTASAYDIVQFIHYLFQSWNIFINITFWTMLVRSVAREYEDIIYTKLKWVSLANRCYSFGNACMDVNGNANVNFVLLLHNEMHTAWWNSENAMRSNEWTNLIVLKFKWCIRIQICVTHTLTHAQHSR